MPSTRDLYTAAQVCAELQYGAWETDKHALRVAEQLILKEITRQHDSGDRT